MHFFKNIFGAVFGPVPQSVRKIMAMNLSRSYQASFFCGCYKFGGQILAYVLEAPCVPGGKGWP